MNSRRRVPQKSGTGWIVLILFASLIARAVLIFSGGQNYWPDEARYRDASIAVDAVLMGNGRRAVQAIHTADHFLFRVVSLLPATVERFVGQNPVIPALFFSLFSVACIWLVWRIALALGASRSAALLAALMLALSTSFLYYCRHLLPYDLSMALGLCALFAAVRSPRKSSDSCVCGIMACGCFLAYNGYWTIAGFAMIVHTLFDPESFSLPRALRRAAVTGISFAVPIGAILLGSRALGGDMLSELVSFSQTINQGTFSEGWSLPFAYLWAAERGILLVWAAVLAGTMVLAIQGKLSRCGWIGLTGFLFVYLCLLFFSVVLHKFVVYGRLARQLVPFACLLTGLALAGDRQKRQAFRRLAAGLGLAIFIQAGFNAWQAYRQEFPRRFAQRATRLELSHAGRGKLVQLNVRHIHDGVDEPDGKHEVLLSSPHPVNFQPYLFEGYQPAARSELKSRDLPMQLILLR